MLLAANPLAAWLSGIDIKNARFIVFVVWGFLAAPAAMIMTARCMSAAMRMLDGLEIDTIAALCIGGISLAGGRGNLVGVVIGVLIVGVISNGMTVLGVDPATKSVAMGAIIFTAVAVTICVGGAVEVSINFDKLTNLILSFTIKQDN